MNTSTKQLHRAFLYHLFRQDYYHVHKIDLEKALLAQHPNYCKWTRIAAEIGPHNSY